MALKFSVLCNLLQSLEDIHRRDPPLLAPDRKACSMNAIDSWFKSHRRAIDSLDKAGAVALLSSLLPERRTDRVYGLQNAGLARALCRQLGLSAVKSKDLRAYTTAGHGDLADCLERVLQGGGPPGSPVVTIGEVDAVMLELASRCKFSALSVQQASSPREPLVSLANLIKRSHPVEAKWLVRIVLKDLAAIHLDENIVLRSIHFLLPDILRYQQDFDAAIETLKTSFATHPSCPDRQSAALVRKIVSGSMRPMIGVKVSRSAFCKARSIDHCLQVANKKHWMLERKYDGEYCEIHIDLSKGEDWLKIFSKSGKDSTQDRRGLRDVLRQSLAIGKPGCRVKKQCIILGEMAVYSDAEKQVMPFHKIRKYVSRSGSYIGTSEDSPRLPTEHLMIVYFDLLLLDDDNMLQKSAEVRKSSLVGLVRTKLGKAMVAESKVIDFAEPDAKKRLMTQMAASIAARHEGIILKPCGRPYLGSLLPGERDASTFIKLKKDYINGLGDEADLAVIGASYNPQVALAKGVSPKDFTHFHVACLVNSEEDVFRYAAKPRFRVVATISCDGCIPPVVLPEANRLARLLQEDYEPGVAPSAFDLHPGTCRMDVVFREPFVFEVLGSSYEKPSDCNYWMLRHPRVKKLHQDRTWRDCVSFVDFQKMANLALSAPPDSESQENIRWMDRIEQSCRRKHARASAQTTPESRCTTSPGSRRRGFTASISPYKGQQPLRRAFAERMASVEVAVDNQCLKDASSSKDLWIGPELPPIALKPLSGNEGRASAQSNPSVVHNLPALSKVPSQIHPLSSHHNNTNSTPKMSSNDEDHSSKKRERDASPDGAAKRQRTSIAHALADSNRSQEDGQDRPTSPTTPLEDHAGTPRQSSPEAMPCNVYGSTRPTMDTSSSSNLDSPPAATSDSSPTGESSNEEGTITQAHVLADQPPPPPRPSLAYPAPASVIAVGTPPNGQPATAQVVFLLLVRWALTQPQNTVLLELVSAHILGIARAQTIIPAGTARHARTRDFLIDLANRIPLSLMQFDRMARVRAPFRFSMPVVDRCDCNFLYTRTNGRVVECPLSRCIVHVARNDRPAIQHALHHGAKVVHTLAELSEHARIWPPELLDREVPDSQESESEEQLLQMVYHLGRPSLSAIRDTTYMLMNQSRAVGTIIIANVFDMSSVCPRVDADMSSSDAATFLDERWRRSWYRVVDVVGE